MKKGKFLTNRSPNVLQQIIHSLKRNIPFNTQIHKILGDTPTITCTGTHIRTCTQTNFTYIYTQNTMDPTIGRNMQETELGQKYRGKGELT